MKRIITVILLLALILAITGEKSQAEEIESVWSNTVNYKNRGSYTDTQLVDRGFFSLIIGVSDDYLVLPLYDLQNNISAYVIQYYNEDVPYSYVVINTRTIVEDAYYIEFGKGNFAEIVGLNEADVFGESIKVYYCGGSEYYLGVDDSLYHFEGELRELDSDLIAALTDRTSGVYYNYGETLTLSAVFSKEVGYDTYSAYTRCELQIERRMVFWEIDVRQQNLFDEGCVCV